MQKKQYKIPIIKVVKLMEELCNGMMTTSIIKKETPPDFEFDPGQAGGKEVAIDEEFYFYEE